MHINHLQQRPGNSACETLNGADRYRESSRQPQPMAALRGLSIAATFAITACFTIGCGSDEPNAVAGASGSLTPPTGVSGATTSPVSSAGTAVTGGKNPNGQGGKAATSGGKTGVAGKKTAGAGGKAGKAGAGGKPATGGAAGSSSTGNSKVPQVDNVVDPGPFEVKYDTNTGPSGSSYVFYPTELGKNGMLHPVLTWGPGAGTGPANYIDHLTQIASHGFVIISQPSSGAPGTLERSALDWILAKNDESGSPFYKKLDLTKVAAGGHSLGALTTYGMSDDERLVTYVLVCGGGGGANLAKMHAPAIILGGDTDMATPQFETDYTSIAVPTVFLIKTGTDHIACARNHLAPWVAWMRWQLYGETKWKSDFWDGVYCKDPWSCRQKNW